MSSSPALGKTESIQIHIHIYITPLFPFSLDRFPIVHFLPVLHS